MRPAGVRLVAAGTLSVVLVAVAPVALAAPNVQLVTPYPAVSVEAGKSVTFQVEVRTPSPQRVGLEVRDVPAGWQATLRGGGFVVHGVYGDPEEPPQVQLDVRVPPDAAQGDYRVAVVGSSGGQTDTLTFDLRVAEVAGGAVTLASEFASLRGAPGSTLTYALTLTNNTPEETNFNLTAEGPQGWQVTARPTAQSQAANVNVEGGGTATVDVEARIPEAAAAETYEIKVRAASGARAAEATLTAEVTGSSRVELTTSDERLNAKAVAGKASELAMVVKNDGTAPVRNVRLSGSPPSGWRVTFRPETIEEVGPRQSARATAVITPTGDAVAGDYVVTFSASAEGVSDSADVRVTVDTSRLFGFVGVAVIIAAFAGLYWVFQRYGRR